MKKDSKKNEKNNEEELLKHLYDNCIKIRKKEVIIRGNDCYCYDNLKWIVAKYKDDYCVFIGYFEDNEFIYFPTDEPFGFLCNTLEELRNLTVKEIESKVYTIYMTFSR